MNNVLVAKALEKYDINYSRFLPSEKGYRNQTNPFVLESSEKANLIIYKPEHGIHHRIKRANQVSDYLHTKGLPTRKTLSPRILRLSGRDVHRYASVYTYLPGHTIPWEGYTSRHIKLLGQMMNRMHKELHKLSVEDMPSVADEYEEIIERMCQYFSATEVAEALKNKLDVIIETAKFNELRTAMKICKRLPAQQILHMDFVRSNILFSKDEGEKTGISGILDFEKTAYGHKLFDIARTLAFLLVDCKYKSSGQVHKYFLISGYVRQGASKFNDVSLGINGKKASLLGELLDVFLLYDFYKFLKHNPYEYLAQNEHYTRTRDLLLARGVITT
jgi:Ser/Thr protein kinase RdoA (MazF antagonist)